MTAGQERKYAPDPATGFSEIGQRERLAESIFTEDSAPPNWIDRLLRRSFGAAATMTLGWIVAKMLIGSQRKPD